jgi:hypothetical protein
MEAKLTEIFMTVWSLIPRGTEFWAAILGALIGGSIAYIGQLRTIHEARDFRDEDRRQMQRALAHSLLFKIVRIYSNSYTSYHFVEECFDNAARREMKAEPWQFVLPLANPPDQVHFSSEEMALLLTLKCNEIFNMTVSLDVAHNSLNDTIKIFNTERRALYQRLYGLTHMGFRHSAFSDSLGAGGFAPCQHR